MLIQGQLTLPRISSFDDVTLSLLEYVYTLYEDIAWQPIPRLDINWVAYLTVFARVTYMRMLSSKILQNQSYRLTKSWYI